MEKLIELLNEYEFKVADTYNYAEREATEDDWERLSERIISKKYWFIEWLYNHKKMTLERLKVSDLYWDINNWVWPVDNIIMHLSISENPIELLISMLK